VAIVTVQNSGRELQDGVFPTSVEKIPKEGSKVTKNQRIRRKRRAPKLTDLRTSGVRADCTQRDRRKRNWRSGKRVKITEEKNGASKLQKHHSTDHESRVLKQFDPEKGAKKFSFLTIKENYWGGDPCTWGQLTRSDNPAV